jgi:hypothetical protein
MRWARAVLLLAPTLLASGCAWSDSSDRSTRQNGPLVTTAPPLAGRSPGAMARALATRNLVDHVAMRRRDRTLIVVMRPPPVGEATDGRRARGIAAIWTTMVIGTAVRRECLRQRDRRRCAAFVDQAGPNGGRGEGGRIFVSHRGPFPPPPRSAANTVIDQLRAMGATVRSVEIDDIGMTVIVARVSVDDPAAAVRRRLTSRVGEPLHPAATLVEVTDQHGGLVTIEGLCDVCGSGVGWTAPRYRSLESTP